MESSNKSILIVFGLKKELEILDPSTKVRAFFGFGKNSSFLINKYITKETKVVINLGFCGSINNEVQCGEIVEAKMIFNESKKKVIPRKYNNTLIEKKIKKLGLKKLNLLTTNNVKSLSEKIDIKKKNDHISLIDMEAFHILKALGNKKISFFSIKLVYDDLSFGIPEYISKTLDKDGGFIFNYIFFKNVLTNPLRVIELIKLGLKFNFCKRKFRTLLKELFNTS